MSSVERQGHTIFEAKVYLPEGVYIRHGAATVPASESSILKMIQATSGDSDETARSIMRQLTFAPQALFRMNVAFSKTQMRTLPNRRRWDIYKSRTCNFMHQLLWGTGYAIVESGMLRLTLRLRPEGCDWRTKNKIDEQERRFFITRPILHCQGVQATRKYMAARQCLVCVCNQYDSKISPVSTFEK